MNTKTFAISLVAMLVVTGCTAVTGGQSGSSSSSDGQTSENFTLSKSYNGNNQWSYIVTGSVPTPCHDVDVQSIVAESFPEQVTIEVRVKDPVEGQICAQVITEKSMSGTFQASEGAKVSLVER